MISSGTEKVPGCRCECGAPDATANTSGRSHLRFTPFRWTALGGVVLALLFAQPTPAGAVTIDSEIAPAVVNLYGERSDLLLDAQATDTGTFDIRVFDPGHNDRDRAFSLTSQIMIDKDEILSESPASSYIARKGEYVPSARILHLDGNHPLILEDLLVRDGYAHPGRLVILTTAASAVLYLFLVLSYRQLQRPRGKRIRFGILWSAYKPICGRCDSLLQVLNDYSFECPSCGVELGARGENGRTISPREALVKIRLKEYW